jgi:hypothetical protein
MGQSLGFARSWDLIRGSVVGRSRLGESAGSATCRHTADLARYVTANALVSGFPSGHRDPGRVQGYGVE